MRHHVTKARLDKERDYIMMEARPFFGDLASMLGLLPLAGCPDEVKTLITKIKTDAEKYDLRRFSEHQEIARQLAWKYMNTNRQHADFLLMLTTWLSNAFLVEAKKPGEYDLSIRPRRS